MGMFDYFNIHNKWIPKNKQVPRGQQSYQTKSLGCFLDLYKVMEDGKLIRFESDFEFKGTMGEWETFKTSDYTGEIRFYDDKNEFIATCVNGVVTEVFEQTVKP